MACWVAEVDGDDPSPGAVGALFFLDPPSRPKHRKVADAIDRALPQDPLLFLKDCGRLLPPRCGLSLRRRWFVGLLHHEKLSFRAKATIGERALRSPRCPASAGTGPRRGCCSCRSRTAP